MVTKRRSYETGHQRKFLAVVDDSPECQAAVFYAAKRAARTNGGLVLLYVCEPGEFQHWLGVGEIMRAEQMEEGQHQLDKFAQYAREKAEIDPELVMREGKSNEGILQLIEEDADIAVLVLAAGTSNDGPGPLVSMVAGKGTSFPIPVMVVPGGMAEEELDAVS